MGVDCCEARDMAGSLIGIGLNLAWGVVSEVCTPGCGLPGSGCWAGDG